MRGTPIQRFWAKVDLPSGDGCWAWTAGSTTEGYGRLWVDGRFVYPHRFSYEHFIGPIPDGHDIDHLCRNHACVRPDHLEPVTRRENLLRGDTLTRAHAERRDCGFADCVHCTRTIRAAELEAAS